jgi:phage gp46-like protein
MANDIKIIWDKNNFTGDFQLNNGDLLREKGLATAALISILTDRRASDDDINDDPNDKRGWWGDLVSPTPIGSKLWLLDRSKTTPDILVKAKQYIEECLQWMIDDEVAIKIEVFVERQGNLESNILVYEVKIHESFENVTTLKFDDLWIMEVL